MTTNNNNEVPPVPGGESPEADHRDLLNSMASDFQQELKGIVADVQKQIPDHTKGGDQSDVPRENTELLSNTASPEEALAWWGNNGRGRSLSERIAAIQADLDHWDKVVREIHELGGEESLARALETIARSSNKRLALENVNRAVRSTLKRIEAGDLQEFHREDDPENTPERGRDKYLKAQFLGHREVLGVAIKVLEDLRKPKSSKTEDVAVVPTGTGNSTGGPVSPTLPQTAADERQRKQLERNAERLEALEKIRAHFQELYNDFQLSEDRPTNRRSYDRYGAGDKAEAGKMVLPPLDEDDGVVANPRELLKQSIHDIYAEFLLAATPEKLQESADGKGVEGKRRFEAYKNRLMNLYNRLWAQIEAAREVGRKQSNIPTDQSNQFGRDSRGVGAAIAKPVDVEIPKVLSPEALERQREIVAELKQKKEYWISRIQACSDKKTFDDITSEGDRISDAWTDCPEFIVGKPFFRLLEEKRISDQQEIQAIKNIAWGLQTEVKVVYLAKRDIFYPPRTADTRGTKPVAVEVPKQETPAQLTPEQMRKFLGGVLKGARKELFLSNARLENLNLDSAKHRLALEQIFLEDILPVIIEEIEKKMPLNQVLREQFIKSLKKLLDEV